MQGKMKKIAAALLLVSIIISGIVFLPSAAEAAQPATYSKQYNSGDRDVVCTTLSGTSASDYYTGEYTYDNLSDLSEGELRSSLHTLMTSTHTYTSSYDECHTLADRTDCENEDKRVTLIYTSYSATMDQWNGWNREHVWPQSLGGGDTVGGGADLHHVRPSDAGVNSSRGNKKYGESGADPSKKYGTDPAKDVLGGTYNSTYFEPLDNVKGDVARICLYVYVRWGEAWGATDVTKVFESVEILLEWCELDPVDTWEMGRNEVVEDIQGNRNVFIDYPELAWQLFGEEIPGGMVTPSGIAMSMGGGSTEAPTENETEIPTEKPDEPGDDETEGDDVLYSNVYFGDTFKLMLASSQKPTLTCEDSNGDTVSLEVKPFMENGKQAEVNGYPVWISENGVPGQSIGKRITVSVGGRTEIYSVLEYLYTRLYVSADVTEAERHAHETLIDYAIKADRFFNSLEESDMATDLLVSVTNGSINGSVSSDLYKPSDTPFESITADISVAEGKKLAWQVSVTANGATTTKIYSDEEIRDLALTGHTVVTAIEMDDGSESGPAWRLVTDVSELSVGDRIIIAAKEYDFAISTTQNTNNRGRTAITKSGNTLVDPSGSVQVFTLENGAADGTFALYTGEAGYRHATSSSSNYMRTKTSLDASGSWSITVSSDGVAQITSQGTYTRNIIKYNNSNALFSCYASTSTMLPISIYVYIE